MQRSAMLIRYCALATALVAPPARRVEQLRFRPAFTRVPQEEEPRVALQSMSVPRTQIPRPPRAEVGVDLAAVPADEALVPPAHPRLARGLRPSFVQDAERPQSALYVVSIGP